MSVPSDPYIYNLCLERDWAIARRDGAYAGSPDDARDGFIHLSTAAQVRDSCAKHRAGVEGLCLLTVEIASVAADLEWEAARHGALFPHLYGPLPVEAVVRVDPLPLGDDGRHQFPDGF